MQTASQPTRRVLDRLSPSKMGEFRTCPQRFAFRYVDRMDEPPDRWMVRGTLVHEVCERLFDLPVEQRTAVSAVALLHRLWERMVDAEPTLRGMFENATQATDWIRSAERLLATWFRIEAPHKLAVEARELFVELPTDGGVVLAGIIDRLDRRPDGTWAITDYKTGRAPADSWALRSFFQLRFYAMVVVSSLGLPVTRLRLVYLADDGEILELPFDPASAAAVGRQVAALAAAMRRALEAGSWRANVGAHCGRCAFQPDCPAWRHPSFEPASADVAAVTPAAAVS